MARDCLSQVTFEFRDKLKPVVARFDQTQASTDGVALLLKALDDRLRLTDQLAACLVNRRDLDKVHPPLRDLLRQRICGVACGYEGANDAARLADDPLHKLAVWVERSVRRLILHLPQGAPWSETWCRMHKRSDVSANAPAELRARVVMSCPSENLAIIRPAPPAHRFGYTHAVVPTAL